RQSTRPARTPRSAAQSGPNWRRGGRNGLPSNLPVIRGHMPGADTRRTHPLFMARFASILKLLSLYGALNPPKGGDGIHERYLICRKKAILRGFIALGG